MKFSDMSKSEVIKYLEGLKPIQIMDEHLGSRSVFRFDDVPIERILELLKCEERFTEEEMKELRDEEMRSDELNSIMAEEKDLDDDDE